MVICDRLNTCNLNPSYCHYACSAFKGKSIFLIVLHPYTRYWASLRQGSLALLGPPTCSDMEQLRSPKLPLGLTSGVPPEVLDLGVC